MYVLAPEKVASLFLSKNVAVMTLLGERINLRVLKENQFIN